MVVMVMMMAVVVVAVVMVAVVMAVVVVGTSGRKIGQAEGKIPIAVHSTVPQPAFPPSHSPPEPPEPPRIPLDPPFHSQSVAPTL